MGANYTLVAVGEMQSDEHDAVLQAGIYSVGMFRKSEVTKKVCVVAVHKNKAANIMLAQLDTSHSTPDSLETVSYKYIQDTNPLSLKSKEGVMDLANRFVTALSVV